MSTKSAGLAKKIGYTNVKVMLKGVPGWKKSGKMVVASDGFVEKGNIILVDLRDETTSANGYVPGAVNIPLDELEDVAGDFPLKAPVVVYGDGDQDTKGYKMISSWGLKTVALINGGLEGYVERGHKLKKGEPEVDIDWERKLGKGEVTLAEFMQVSDGKVKDAVILDVRTTDEAGGGRFANSIAIPLDDLEKRLGELPKDKKILVHCSTGARAEMAQALLSKEGYNCKFLVAEVKCESGECEAE